jgi:hypothetical protein
VATAYDSGSFANEGLHGMDIQQLHKTMGEKKKKGPGPCGQTKEEEESEEQDEEEESDGGEASVSASGASASASGKKQGWFNQAGVVAKKIREWKKSCEDAVNEAKKQISLSTAAFIDFSEPEVAAQYQSEIIILRNRVSTLQTVISDKYANAEVAEANVQRMIQRIEDEGREASDKGSTAKGAEILLAKAAPPHPGFRKLHSIIHLCACSTMYNSCESQPAVDKVELKLQTMLGHVNQLTDAVKAGIKDLRAAKTTRERQLKLRADKEAREKAVAEKAAAKAAPKSSNTPEKAAQRKSEEHLQDQGGQKPLEVFNLEPCAVDDPRRVDEGAPSEIKTYSVQEFKDAMERKETDFEEPFIITDLSAMRNLSTENPDLKKAFENDRPA